MPLPSIMSQPPRPPRSQQTEPVLSQREDAKEWRFWEQEPEDLWNQGPSDFMIEESPAAVPVAMPAHDHAPASSPVSIPMPLPEPVRLQPLTPQPVPELRTPDPATPVISPALADPKPPRKRRFRLSFLAVFAVFVSGSFAAIHLLRAYKVSKARNQATEAVAAMKDQEWKQARDLLSPAARSQPNDPEVIRAIIQWHSLTGGHPQNVISALRRLIDQGLATDEDWLHLARAEHALGHLSAADAALRKLTPSTRERFDVMDFEAVLLRDAGRSQEAADQFRTLLEGRKAEPAAAFRLALLDYGNPALELQDRGRLALRKAAHGKGVEALTALHLLSADPNLTRDEVDDLFHLTDTRSDASEARYRLFAKLLQLTPTELTRSLLDDEMKRAITLEGPARLTFVSALSTGLPPATVLAFAETELGKSEITRREHPLQNELLHLTLETLAQLNQWKDVQERLRTAEARKLGAVPFNLWKACVAAELEHDPKTTVRTHLQIALDTSTSAKDIDALIHCADTAARLDQYDLAAATYEQLADDERMLPPAQLGLLEKALAAQRHLTREVKALLPIAHRLAASPAASDTHHFEADYLSLLSGGSPEPIVARLATQTAATDDLPRLQHDLLRAMIYHQQHQTEALQQSLQAISTEHASQLAPGPRAVLADLFIAAGETQRAMMLAKSSPRELLLNEEVNLLANVRDSKSARP